jgi:hypothetical protein
VSDDYTLHLFLISTRTGETTVFLIETADGVVEFPTITANEKVIEDETELVRRIVACTGMEAAISGFLTPPAPDSVHPANSKFLICRVLSGTPSPAIPHVGWEWRPGNNLLSLQFLPKMMVDELRVFMNT